MDQHSQHHPNNTPTLPPPSHVVSVKLKVKERSEVSCCRLKETETGRQTDDSYGKACEVIVTVFKLV